MDGGEGVLPLLSPPPLPLPPAAAAVAAVAATVKDDDDGGGAAARQACAKGWRVRSRGAESRRGGAVGMKGSCSCCASAWTVWTAPACARQLARSASMRRAFSTSTSGAGAGAAGVAWSLPMWVPARSSPHLSVDAAPVDEVEVEVVEVVEARRRMRASRAREAARARWWWIARADAARRTRPARARGTASAATGGARWLAGASWEAGFAFAFGEGVGVGVGCAGGVGRWEREGGVGALDGDPEVEMLGDGLGGAAATACGEAAGEG